MPTIGDWRWYVLEILESDRGYTWEEAFGWVDEEDLLELEIAIRELQLERRIRVERKGERYRLIGEPERP